MAAGRARNFLEQKFARALRDLLHADQPQGVKLR